MRYGAKVTIVEEEDVVVKEDVDTGVGNGRVRSSAVVCVGAGSVKPRKSGRDCLGVVPEAPEVNLVSSSGMVTQVYSGGNK